MPPLSLATPPAPGKGQVAITADEPSLVERVTGHAEGVTPGGFAIDELTYKTVCAATPCVTTLAFGRHDLRLTSIDDPAHHRGVGSVTVGPQPIDYRFALGHQTDPSSGWMVPFIVGVGATVAGITLIGIGQPTTLDQNLNEVPGWNARPTGIVTTIAGAALTAFSLWLWSKDVGTSQAGTGVQWEPSNGS